MHSWVDGKPFCRTNSGRWGGDLARNVYIEVPHTAETVTIHLVNAANQVLTDEAYGFNSLVIEVISCSKTCATCASADTCATCHPSALLQNGQCICRPGAKVLTQYPRSCTPTCHASCNGCKSQDVCNQCGKGAKLSSPNLCECKPGYKKVKNSPLECEPIQCHPSCTLCSGPGEKQCLECPANAELKSGSCSCKEGFSAKETKPLTCVKQEVVTCPENANLVEKNGQKTCDCKPGYFEESKTPLKCKRIPCHFSCKLCSGPEAHKCLECYENAEIAKSEEGDNTCECNPPNILWQTSPRYVCGRTFVKYDEVKD
eukprot:TRINITY_DN11540_c0_g1_i2.p1 TRINITY_DN11540_c0_g1~~TRINITY_DN11540_c0_g1_i2.p1  ORF type:complete len:315 (-),score=44.63 TRINITY_DN11540_c0_g1_i2:126-1070(-)